MRLQGVDLGDARHIGHKGAAHGTTRAYQVAVGHGLLYQPLRHEVERGVAVADDGIELLIEPLLHHLGQGVAIDLVGAGQGHIA